MREIYSKEDLKQSLFLIANNEKFNSILITALIEIKLKRLQSEYEKISEIHERHKPIIKRNIGKEIKDYDVSAIMVEVINNNSKLLVKLNKNILFYTKIFNDNFQNKISEKRINLLISLIEKSI